MELNLRELDLYDTYDGFANIYNSHWGPRYGKQSVPLLKRMLVDKLSSSANILDLCCGAGHIAQGLIREGYTVTDKV